MDKIYVSFFSFLKQKENINSSLINSIIDGTYPISSIFHLCMDGILYRTLGNLDRKLSFWLTMRYYALDIMMEDIDSFVSLEEFGDKINPERFTQSLLNSIGTCRLKMDTLSNLVNPEDVLYTRFVQVSKSEEWKELENVIYKELTQPKNLNYYMIDNGK